MKNLGTKTLETERLILRKINKNDYKMAYKNYCSNINVAMYVTWEVHKNELETKELFDMWIDSYNDTTYKWIIEYKSNHEVIGMIDAFDKFFKYSSCEIGYVLSEEYWNKGIMTEALKEVIRFLFLECEVEVIYADFMELNPASGKVMEKSGMKYEGILRGRMVDKLNRRNNLLSYSILKDDYMTH